MTTERSDLDASAVADAVLLTWASLYVLWGLLRLAHLDGFDPTGAAIGFAISLAVGGALLLAAVKPLDARWYALLGVLELMNVVQLLDSAAPNLGWFADAADGSTTAVVGFGSLVVVLVLYLRAMEGWEGGDGSPSWR